MFTFTENLEKGSCVLATGRVSVVRKGKGLRFEFSMDGDSWTTVCFIDEQGNLEFPEEDNVCHLAYVR